MQFSEHQMTVAVDTIAKELFLARGMPWRRRKRAAAWETLDPFARYQHRAAAGEMILPTLAALPDAQAQGERATFTMPQLLEAAESGARALADQRAAGSWEAMSEKKRSRVVRLTAMLTHRALKAMPPRPPERPADGV